MLLKGAEVHKYVLIKHCHNFLCMMHWWKIAYDMIIVDDTRKIVTPDSSMMGRPDLQPQLVKVKTRKTRPGRNKKDEIWDNLVLSITSSWVSWMVNITIQTQGITPHSVIDKIDGNHCQRRLDQSGQTIRYQKQLEVTFETVDLHEGRRLFCGCAIKALIYGEGSIENFH